MDEQERVLQEDSLVVAALRSAGTYVTSSEDLVKTREPYPKAVPVLLEMLPKVQTYTIKGIIVRSLGVKEAKGRAEPALISEFESSLPDSSNSAQTFRWIIANTFEIWGGGKGASEALLRFLVDPRSGRARGMLSLALAKTKNRDAIPILLKMLEEDDFTGFVAEGLGILRAEAAIPKLKEIVRGHSNANAWVRRQAKTALKRLGVDEVIQEAKKASAKPKGEVRSPGNKRVISQKKRSNEVPSSGSLAERLSVLADCGIKVSTAVTPNVLTSRIPPQGPEKDSYKLLLCALGEEADADSEVEYAGYISDDIWHFDTECIEDHGSYAAIAERMAALAQGDLPLENIDDCVDIEEGEAWLSFTLDGRSYKWTAKVDDDWVDPSIFSRFGDLLASRKIGKRFTYIDLKGQDCLIGCATPEQRACLEAKTGLKVEWLT